MKSDVDMRKDLCKMVHREIELITYGGTKQQLHCGEDNNILRVGVRSALLSGSTSDIEETTSVLDTTSSTA